MKTIARGTQDKTGSRGYDSMVTEWWVVDLEDWALPVGYRCTRDDEPNYWATLFDLVLEHLNLSPYGVTSKHPGSYFENRPCVRFVGRRALVTIRWGYDV